MTAITGYTYPTLVDQLKRLNPDGSIATVGEVLEQMNPLLSDMAWIEGNLATGHRFVSRSALPALTWRKYNQGVDASKSTTEQHEESCGMLTGYSKVDVKLAELNGNGAAFRASEDLAFVQSFNNQLNTALFYANMATNPEQFQGLSPRLGTTTNNPATVTGTGPTGTGQLIKGGTASVNTNTSIWLIGWSPETVFGIYPKGSVGGLSHHDMGEQLVPDASGTKQFRAYVSEWSWQCGLCVKDYRFAARVCNIDTSLWTADLSAGDDLAMLMMSAQAAIYSLEACRPVFYMSRKTFNMLGQQLVAREGNWLNYLDQGGAKVPSFYGVPIRFCDALINAESTVS